ncbi:MAG: hypothetical protein NTX25_06935 [Proteobacteria bacterium]|nr:hypothetical protein [Pseudomonadota bacterium]
MKDFLDILREEMDQPKALRDQALYLSRLRGMISHRPDPRPFPLVSPGTFLKSRILSRLPDQLISTDFDLGFFDLKEGLADPHWFRLAKQMDPSRAFLRWDPLLDEAEILGSLAMGADAYSLMAGAHDAAELQYLCEIGGDYGVPALLHCHDEAELAKALFVQAETCLMLLGKLAEPQLLELPIFHKRTVLIKIEGPLVPTLDSLDTRGFDRLILHLDSLD